MRWSTLNVMVQEGAEELKRTRVQAEPAADKLRLYLEPHSDPPIPHFFTQHTATGDFPKRWRSCTPNRHRDQHQLLSPLLSPPQHPRSSSSRPFLKANPKRRVYQLRRAATHFLPPWTPPTKPHQTTISSAS